MLNQLIQLIQEQSQDAVVKNPAVPDQYNQDVMQTMVNSISGGMQEEVQRGNVEGVMGLLSGRTATGTTDLLSNPIVASISHTAASKLTERFGLTPGLAQGIVAAVLPMVMSRLISKTSNPNDSSIDFNDILGSLMGGNPADATPGTRTHGADFNEIGYALADGKLDMNDLMRIGGGLLGKR